MKTANDFYAECLEAFIEVSRRFGYAQGGARGNEALMKCAAKSVRELLKFKPLIQLHGNNPPMYYYYINGLAFAMGVVLAMLQANAPQKFADRDLIPMIVNDPETSAHDLAFHTLQQYGLHPDVYNQLVQELYKKFQDLHEPYWKAKEPRDYTLSAFYASFMTGCSVVLEKYAEKCAQKQMTGMHPPAEEPQAPKVQKKSVKPAAKKTAGDVSAKRSAARKTGKSAPK